MLSALVVLEIADGQDDPILLMPVAWDQVKSFCVAEAQRLGQDWLGRN